MVTTNFYDFLNWFDELAWYPLGRIVGGTVYPGLMVTAGGIHWFLNGLGKLTIYYFSRRFFHKMKVSNYENTFAEKVVLIAKKFPRKFLFIFIPLKVSYDEI
jgi:hypothetical protein